MRHYFIFLLIIVSHTDVVGQLQGTAQKADTVSKMLRSSGNMKIRPDDTYSQDFGHNEMTDNIQIGFFYPPQLKRRIQPVKAENLKTLFSFFHDTTLTPVRGQAPWVQHSTSTTDPTPTVDWVKTQGSSGNDRSYKVAVDNGGNTYITGFVYDNNAGENFFFLSKYNPAGTLLWTRKEGDSSYSASGYGLAIDPTGNVIVTGGFANFTFMGLTNPSAGDDGFIAKYDASGNRLWVKGVIGSGNSDYGTAVGTDAAGNIYAHGFFEETAQFGGTTTLTASGKGDMYVMKLTATGVVVWVRQASVGVDNYVDGIAVDGAGNSYVTGNFADQATFQATGQPSVTITSVGGKDVYLAKYGPTGSLEWVRTGGGKDNDGGNQVAVSPDGTGVYVTGYFRGSAIFGQVSQTSTGEFDVLVARYTSQGAVDWVRQFGGTQNQSGFSISADKDGNAYVTGWFTGSIAFSNAQPALRSGGGADVYTLKFSKSGLLRWADQTTSGPNNEYGFGIFANSSNVYVTGRFAESVLFSNSTRVTSNGEDDVFVLRYKNPPPSPITEQVTPLLSYGSSVVSNNVAAGRSLLIVGEQFTPLNTVNIRVGGGSYQRTYSVVADRLGKWQYTLQTGGLASQTYLIEAIDVSSNTTARQVLTFIIQPANRPVDTYLNVSSVSRITPLIYSVNWTDLITDRPDAYTYNATGTRRTYRYRIDYDFSTSETLPPSIYRNTAGVNSGTATVGSTARLSTSFTIPATQTGYLFVRVSDADLPTRFDTGGINLLETNNTVSVTLNWDYWQSQQPDLPQPTGVAADGTARLIVKVAPVGRNIARVRLTLRHKEAGQTTGSVLGKLAVVKAKSEVEQKPVVELNATATSLDNTTALNGEFWFWYLAPDDFSTGPGQSSILAKRVVLAKAELYDATGTLLTTLDNVPIQVVRPPLMLVHGINADATTWDDFKPAALFSIFGGESHVARHAVTLYPGSSFTDNANVLLGQDKDERKRGESFDALLITLRKQGYAGNRIDYVAHSMGGSVLRHTVAQFPAFFYTDQNYLRGYINKFITLDTPHQGSPLGDVVSEFATYIDGSYWFIRANRAGKLDSFLDIPGDDNRPPRVTPATANLALRTELGGIRFPETPLKNHLIVGDYVRWFPTPTSALDALDFIDKWGLSVLAMNLLNAAIVKTKRCNCATEQEQLQAINRSSNDYEKTWQFMNWQSSRVNPLAPAFFQNSDLIVSVASQSAGQLRTGLSTPIPSHISTFTVNHSFNPGKVVASPPIGERVLNLLNTRIADASFANSLPASPILSTTYSCAADCPAPSGRQMVQQVADTSKIKIISPGRTGVALVANAPLTIQIQVKDTVKLYYVQVEFEGNFYTLNDINTILSLRTQVMGTLLGKQLLRAKAVYRRSVGVYETFTDEIEVTIAGSGPLTGLQTNPVRLILGRGEVKSIELSALFATQSARIAPTDPLLTISVSNTSVVTFNRAQFQFTGRTTGESFAIFTYQGRSVSLGILVTNGLDITATLASQTVCSGASVAAFIKRSGLIGTTEFTVQLSDAAGTFATPTAIYSGSATTDSVRINIPSNLTASDVYRLRILVANPAFVGTESGPISVRRGPTGVSVTASGPTSVYSPATVLLSATTGANYGYQWLRNDQALANATSSTFTVSISGNYSNRVRLNGCTTTTTPVGVEILTPLAIDPTTADPVEVTPNPTNGDLWIRLPAWLNYPIQLQLTNLLGQDIRRQKVATGATTVRWSVQGLSAGVYLLTITDSGKNRIGKRILIGQ